MEDSYREVLLSVCVSFCHLRTTLTAKFGENCTYREDLQFY